MRNVQQLLESPNISDQDLRDCIAATSVAPWQATSCVRGMANDLLETRAALRERVRLWWLVPVLGLLVVANTVISIVCRMHATSP